MERAASCRRAAREAVADVEPPELHALIGETLEDASMTPGVLTIESATAIDSNADLEAVTQRAAGVQLIYEGLRLTRSLAHGEPWADEDPTPEPGPETEPADGDLAILAADILVARGFYLLARTEAAEKAVRTVKAFGRDQALPDRADDASLPKGNLERDVLELAILTGAVTVGASPTAELLALAEGLVDGEVTTFPPADDCLGDLSPDAIAAAVAAGQPREIDAEADADSDATPGDGIATDRATSATDP